MIERTPMHWMTKLVALVALLVLIIPVAVANASTQLTWAGQNWHYFKGTGHLGQVWSPAMVSVDSTGVLTEKIRSNMAGGIGSTTWRTYGTYSAQFRMTPGAGKMVMILKGHEGTPYNELDMAEGKVGDSARTQITATRHWGVGRANMSQHRIAVNYTRWHTVTVHWTASAMTVALDGHVFATYTTHVSHTPMDLALQTAGSNVGGAGAPSQFQVRNLTIR